MARPRLIILVRHAQSEGNKNREIHQTTPDHRVKLTPEGQLQAREAGHRLRKLLQPDDTIQIFTSPYRRTRETTEGILSTLTSDDPEPSPFRRSNITVYEEPRLREQDFGNFQPCSAEMERMWQERADYGHFFYRIPNGESAADAYDRVSGFNESLWRQFGEDTFPSVCVLVTHGLMSRVFLMKWYHFTVEYFEDLRNVDHCEFLIMRLQDNGKYHLETKLRTWSELRQERAEVSKDKNADDAEIKDEVKLARNKTFVSHRKWGGCPNGCNHSSHYKKRHDLEALREREIEREAAASIASRSTSPIMRKHRPKMMLSSDEEGADGDDDEEDGAKPSKPRHIVLPSKDLETPGVAVTPTTEVDQFITANDATAAYLRKNSPHLHVGRDFGGTYSGHASTAGSDTDASEDDRRRHGPMAALKSRLRLADDRPHARNYSIDSNASNASIPPANPGPFVNRLGDAPPFSDSGMDDADPTPSSVAAKQSKESREKAKDVTQMSQEDFDAAEAEDKSVQGSVY